MAQYPAHLVRKRRLFNGTEVTVRPVMPQDLAMEQEFVRRMSEDSRYFRFMAHLHELPKRKRDNLVDIDYDRHMALVATVPQADGRDVEIGTAQYVADPGEQACEFAIAVADDWQGSGVAGVLMATLIEAAREAGLARMEGYVLASNRKMLKFARQLGFQVHRHLGDADTVHVVYELNGPPAAI